jgi:hypothetical protein
MEVASISRLTTLLQESRVRAVPAGVPMVKVAVRVLPVFLRVPADHKVLGAPQVLEGLPVVPLLADRLRFPRVDERFANRRLRRFGCLTRISGRTAGSISFAKVHSLGLSRC